MTYSKSELIKAYKKTRTLRGACLETGVPPYIGYSWLKSEGLISQNDKVNTGKICSAKLGAIAEQEFQRLVPWALNANKNLQASCPAFDFDVSGVKVDVKYSTVQSRGYWNFKVAFGKALRPDYYAVFCATGASLKDGYRLFLFPDELLEGRRNVYILPEKIDEELAAYEVLEPEYLRDVFSEVTADD